MPFTTKDIPSLTGKTALVTGANTGLGYETAYVLAHAGANVYLAVRNPAKGEAARERILASKPSGSAEVAVLDLSDLDKVKAFAAEFAKTHAHLDILVANAGVMLPNPPTKTVQGAYRVSSTVRASANSVVCRVLGKDPCADDLPAACDTRPRSAVWREPSSACCADWHAVPAAEGDAFQPCGDGSVVCAQAGRD